MLINYNGNFDPSQPWSNGIRSIGNIMATMPAIRANAAARMAEARYRDAATTEAGARTGLYSAQTRSVNDENTGHLQFASALKKLALNPNDTDALGDAFEGAGKGFKTDPENTTKAMGILLSQIAARNGSTNFAQMGALQGGATSIANNQADNAERAARPLNITGAEMTPEGKILGVAPRIIPLGSALTSGAEGTNAPTIVATNDKPVPAAAPALPPSVQAEVFKSLLANEGGGTNTVTALTGLQKAMGGQPAAQGATNEVQRLTKDGKTAIFDATTKQFLRYAN